MIERLKICNKIDIYDFLERVDDKFQDFYLTKEKERIFLKGNWSLIEKTLKHQEVYGLFNNGLKGILLIYKNKGYRPYIKMLAISNKYYYNLLMYLRFNFMNKELFAKLKLNNPLVQILERKGFISIGKRGKEILLHKQAIKEKYKLIPKDSYLFNEDKRLY